MIVEVKLKGMRWDKVGGKGMRNIMNGELIIIKLKMVMIGSINGLINMRKDLMSRIEKKRRGWKR